MSEKKEITGWVAWHPFTKEMTEINHGIVWTRPELAEDFCHKRALETSKMLKLGGWRIRPVKLVFTDEGADGDIVNAMNKILDSHADVIDVSVTHKSGAVTTVGKTFEQLEEEEVADEGEK